MKLATLSRLYIRQQLVDVFWFVVALRCMSMWDAQAAVSSHEPWPCLGRTSNNKKMGTPKRMVKKRREKKKSMARRCFSLLVWLYHTMNRARNRTPLLANSAKQRCYCRSEKSPLSRSSLSTNLRPNGAREVLGFTLDGLQD